MTTHNRIPSLLCGVESTEIGRLQRVQPCRAEQGVKMKMSVFILHAPPHSDTRTIFPQFLPLTHLSLYLDSLSPLLSCLSLPVIVSSCKNHVCCLFEKWLNLWALGQSLDWIPSFSVPVLNALLFCCGLVSWWQKQVKLLCKIKNSQNIWTKYKRIVWKSNLSKMLLR